MRDLLVLSSPATDASDLKMVSVLSALGATIRRAPACSAERPATAAGVILHAETLATYRDRALDAGENVLVYGFPARDRDDVLQRFTGGAVRGVEEIGARGDLRLPADGRAFTRQLAGLERPTPPELPSAAGFILPDGSPCSVLITMSGKPTFVCLRVRNVNLFLTTVEGFPSSDQPVISEGEILPLYDALLPLLVFARATCREYRWHGGPPAARLIIDDAPLRRRYGRLDFAQLFESLRRHDYAASMAYIPWNHFRTTQRTAAFFRAGADRLSLCIHGCDHTNNEYGRHDIRHLLSQSHRAIRRLRRHEARTGLTFEPVMVFPQNRFSPPALSALRNSGYAAAINSTRFPATTDAPRLTLRDTLRPAITAFGGCPLFLRHDSWPVFPFFLDLFLGRPAFILEHHEFFRDGFPALEALVRRLKEAEPALSWNSLRETVENTCWKRAVTDTRWEVEFFGDRYSLTNDSPQQRTYWLQKLEFDPKARGVVLLGDQVIPMERMGESIAVELSLAPGEVARAYVTPGPAPAWEPVRRGALYAGRVLARRALSELRDEILVNHPALLAPTKTLARILKASADSF
jgi:hypothetical protein